MRATSIVTIIIVSVLGAASAQGMGHAHGTTEQHGHGSDGSMGMPGVDMPVAFEDEAGFLKHMILHHQEAVASAEQVLEVAERAELLALARDVIEAQRAEIEMMEAWLEAWYPERTEEVTYEPMMRDLGGLSSDEAERAFLEGMIMHHMMAVRDAQHLLEHDLAEHDEVAALARDIIADQMREIEQMQAWLREWFDAPVDMGMSHEAMPGTGMMGQDMRPHGMMGGAHMRRMHERMHGTGTSGVHGMHPMIEAFMRMMGETMRGLESMMTDESEHGIGEAGVRAIARAFLDGRGGNAEIVDVEAPRNVYRITYRDGAFEGVLLVDADTGEVTPEPAID